MKKIGFVGAYDKTDLILYVARILVETGKTVLVVDSTTTQKAKYIVPVINPTTSYVTYFEGIEVAVGFHDFIDMKRYLGMPDSAALDYDYILIDIDNPQILENFGIDNSMECYFVTSFDLYSLKRGLEILSGITETMELTKVLFSKNMTKEEDDYLNFLSMGYKIKWEEERIYFPMESSDRNVIIENQRLSKIKLKRLSTAYKDSLIYLTDKIDKDDNSSVITRAVKQIEKGA